MEFEHIIQLIQAVSESSLTQFCYENDNIKIKMKTDKEQTLVSCVPPMPVPGTYPGTMGYGVPAEGSPTPAGPEILSGGGMSQGTALNPAGGPAMAMQQPDVNLVKSPLVGTFYAAASPEDAPFVKVGDTVTKGQVLGIVEAMKLMNEIESDYAGVVKEILVSNGDIIEYGQPMFVIE